MEAGVHERVFLEVCFLPVISTICILLLIFRAIVYLLRFALLETPL